MSFRYGRLLKPTHRGKTAMNGARELLGWRRDSEILVLGPRMSLVWALKPD
jgi:hypothetical protein